MLEALGAKMLFDSIDSLKMEGFTGFISIADLQTSCSAISRERGIYLVSYLGDTRPIFYPKGTGGYHKGSDSNVDIFELERKWVDGTIVVYIGQAGGMRDGKWSDATLYRRIRQYIRFGQGQPVGHRGGRYIWQMKNYEDLIFCWKPLPNNIEDPMKVEGELLKEFKKIYGRLPFANLKE